MGRGGGLGQECEQVKMENEGNKNGGAVAAPPPQWKCPCLDPQGPCLRWDAGLARWRGVSAAFLASPRAFCFCPLPKGRGRYPG